MKGVDEVFELAVTTAVGQETAVQGQDPSRNLGGNGKKARKRTCKFL